MTADTRRQHRRTLCNTTAWPKAGKTIHSGPRHIFNSTDEGVGSKLGGSDGEARGFLSANHVAGRAAVEM
eukprot:509019-Pyramimonas_sp.AAC.2